MAAIPALAAAPPEVAQICAPADRAVAVFPRRTELRGLSRDRFESLLASSRERSAALATDMSPRIVRAAHKTSWTAGILEGETDLIVTNPGPIPAFAPAAPWNPAVVKAKSGSGASSPLAAGVDGRVFARVDFRGTGTVRVFWRLAAKQGTDGRVFPLMLPRVDASELTLDLPAGFEPEIADAVRQGPLETDSARIENGRRPRAVGVFSALLGARRRH